MERMVSVGAAMVEAGMSRDTGFDRGYHAARMDVLVMLDEIQAGDRGNGWGDAGNYLRFDTECYLDNSGDWLDDNEQEPGAWSGS
jgi:hypothetical protein